MNKLGTCATLAALMAVAAFGMIMAPAMAGSSKINAHCCVCDTCTMRQLLRMRMRQLLRMRMRRRPRLSLV
jgi:hypothetical protein